MAAIYFFIWAAFVWSCVLYGAAATNNLCPSGCMCLGDCFDCSRNGLIEVPKDLRTCPWVTNLEIQSNGISTLHPDDFKGLVQLEKVDLSNNEIETIDEGVFINVPAMKELKINSNKLTEIPVLTGNQNLKRLELTRNVIHMINSTILSHLVQLDTLDLSYNDIMDLPNGTFPANLTLTKVFLRNNKIFNLETGFLYNLTKLESLKLNKNKISHLPLGLFKVSSELRSLDLSKNQLSRLMGLTFSGLDSLQVFRLRKNAIHTLEDGVFYGLGKLQHLHLDENNLTVIAQNWLYGLDNLKELSLSFNKISRIEPNAWQHTPKLETLDLSHNQIKSITLEMFSTLTNLKTLQLGNNQIEIIQDEAFKQIPKLEELGLNNNRIASTIEDVKEVFRGLGALRRLHLANNTIKTITKTAFAGLESLEELHLTSNNITSIQGNAFEPMMQLRQLTFNSSSLFCDCQLSWVPIWLRDNNFDRDVVARCAHPKHLKGKNVFAIGSNEFKCDGHFPKPVIVTHPHAQVALKGDNITLNCTAASTEDKGTPTKFQWKKDNVLLSDAVTEDYATRSDNLTRYISKINIKNAQDNDAGRYQCVISNEFGAAYSDRANINVYVFPRFTKRPQNITAKASTEAVLVCAAEGQPKPNITWQKDGGFNHFPAAQERRMHVIPEDDHFYIVDVKAADEGVYSCIAKNDAGTIMANVTLTVLQRPSFVRDMESKETKVGDTTVLECLAQGSPQPKLTWYKDEAPLVLSQRHFFTAENQLLVIVETETRDAGKYTCAMSNTLGTIRGTSTLTVITGGGARSSSEEGSGGGGLDDESTTTGIIIIAVVCCVVGTSLVWVIIIYRTRKHQELYSATPTDETTLPGENPSSGYMSSDKEGSYTHGVPVTVMPAGYQYHDMQMKESGYESSSGRFRAARSAAIFPSDVDGEDLPPNYNLLAAEGHYIEHSDENSMSSQDYPRSDTDSIKSEANSVNSSRSSGQQILTTFHPHATTRVGLSHSHSCLDSQRVCDSTDIQYDTGQVGENKGDNSVSSQTDECGGPSCGPCENDTDGATSGNNNINLCRKCGEDSSQRDTHVCRHNSPPIPPKPSQLRHGRHKEHTHFDRAQPPGMSLSNNDIQDCAVNPSMYDENIPQSLLVPCPSLYVQPEYGHQDGVYVPNGSLGNGRAAYVPVYHHPVNTPCTCHLHYPTPAPTSHKHSRDQRPVKENSTNPRNNQRINGMVGCVHHHVNNVNPAGAWHRHAYTLPYLPGHHVHQMQTFAPKVPPRQQSKLSRNTKEPSTSPRQQTSTSPQQQPSTSPRQPSPRQQQGKSPSAGSQSNGQSVSTKQSDDV